MRAHGSFVSSRPGRLAKHKKALARRYWRGETDLQPATLRRIWEVWQLYHELQQEGSLPPTVREAQEMLGYASWSKISHALKILELWGVIRSDRGRSRTRRVLVPYNQWLGD